MAFDSPWRRSGIRVPEHSLGTEPSCIGECQGYDADVPEGAQHHEAKKRVVEHDADGDAEEHQHGEHQAPVEQGQQDSGKDHVVVQPLGLHQEHGGADDDEKHAQRVETARGELCQDVGRGRNAAADDGDAQEGPLGGYGADA